MNFTLAQRTSLCLVIAAYALSHVNDAAAAPTAEELELLKDPSSVVGSDTCIKCHGNELNVWKQTPHYQTFRELHRNPRAKEIAKKMGLSSIKRGGICIDCHYTTQLSSSGKHRPIEGISCESCHGPAKDWVATHSDYGGPTVSRASESPQHKIMRRKQAIAAGMRNPSNLYLIARSCYDCHTVPNEKLVNVGGHKAGSVDFELVAWSQGAVRHNFIRGNGTNAPSALPRTRVMYVVGVLTDIEYALRATAIATEAKTYAVTNANRVARQRKKLIEMNEVLKDDLLTKAIEASYSAGLKLENKEALLAAAGKVGQVAYDFAEQRTGEELTAIQGMLPKPEEYWYKRK